MIEHGVTALANARVEVVREILLRAADHDTGQPSARRVAEPWHRLIRARRVEGVHSRDHLEADRRVVHRAADDANVVERRRERDETVSADAPVRWFHANNAAER